MRNPLLSLWLQSMLLGVEAQQVMALRMMRLFAGGAAAEAEMWRMCSEKPAAAALAIVEASTAAATGRQGAAIARGTIRGYRKRVRANHRRLARK